MASGHWHESHWVGSVPGTCADLSTPALAVADNGDQTVTATITGGEADAANVVRFLRYWQGGTWQLFGSRTGPGTVGPVAMLPGAYLFKVDSTVDACNVVGDLVTLLVRGISVGAIKPAVRHWLMSRPEIAAVVGERIYPGKVPQTERDYPRIVLRRISGRHENHLVGPSNVMTTTLELTCAATTHDAAETLGKLVVGTEVEPALDGFAGTIGPAGEQVVIQAATLQDQHDEEVSQADGSDRTEWQNVLTFAVWYEEE